MSAGAAVRLEERTDAPEPFFALLPEDWQEGIVPHWDAYRGDAQLFTLEADDELLGGGILFRRISPDTETYGNVARVRFERGYLYLGFIWIAQQHRNRGLASRWLAMLRERFPGQPFWLSVEDPGLIAFYERNGFLLECSVQGEDGEEWILVSGEPRSA